MLKRDSSMWCFGIESDTSVWFSQKIYTDEKEHRTKKHSLDIFIAQQVKYGKLCFNHIKTKTQTQDKTNSANTQGCIWQQPITFKAL